MFTVNLEFEDVTKKAVFMRCLDSFPVTSTGTTKDISKNKETNALTAAELGVHIAKRLDVFYVWELD